MAREGIYVGGKEIVRRYVGDKLVWGKFELLVTNYFGNWSTEGSNIASQIIRRNETRGYDESTLRYVSVIKVGGKIFYPNSVTIINSYDSRYATYNDSHEKIVFKNEYDRNLFISLVQRGETVYYGRKGNRR